MKSAGQGLAIGMAVVGPILKFNENAISSRFTFAQNVYTGVRKTEVIFVIVFQTVFNFFNKYIKPFSERRRALGISALHYHTGLVKIENRYSI